MEDHTQLLIGLMQKTIEQKDEQIKEPRETVARLQATVANLNETLEEFRRKFFGSSSEKTGRKKTREEGEGEESRVTVKSHTRERKAKSKREELYQNLPVREVRCPVGEEGRLCPDYGTPMETVTWQYVREELSITPAKVERVHYLREVLDCPVCRAEDEGTFTKAAAPVPLLSHSPASPSMVAYVMYQRFMNSVPFYRQEMDWLQRGAPLVRETTANWCVKCALEYFQPVYDLLHETLLKRDVLHAAETDCQVLREKGREAASSSYMWIYLTGNDGLAPIILYEYQPGRKGEYAKNFLEGFRGLLECDGYTGYNQVENVTLVCCLAHCRRYFFEAVPAVRRRKIKLLDTNSPEEIPQEEADPERAKEQQPLPAEVGLCYCDLLFRIERTLKDLAPEERKERRLKEEVPVWEGFWEWLGTLNPLSGSRLEKAVNYAANHREPLGNYLLDGRSEISNNRAERRAKAYGTGRKNFLFHTSVKGAKASAIIYSLVETAKANRLNVFQYLYTLLLYMPDNKDKPAGVEAMMPWSEFVKERCCGVMDAETERPATKLITAFYLMIRSL